MSAVRLDVVLLRDARMHTSTNGDAVLELMVSRYAAGSVPMLLQQVVGRGFAAQHACSAAAARLRRGTAVQVWGDCIGYDRVRRCLVVTGVDHISPLAGAPRPGAARRAGAARAARAGNPGQRPATVEHRHTMTTPSPDSSSATAQALLPTQLAETPLPPLLIGLCGPAGAGKDTVGDYLCEQFAFQGLALAEPICNMLYALFADAGVPSCWMTERALKEKPTSLGYSYRQLAQSLGTEWGREQLDGDMWLRIAQRKARQVMDMGDSVVVTDIRFANEADWIRASGGHLVRVSRASVEPVRAHASEAGAASLQADHELINNGSMSTLYEQIDRLMALLRATQG